VHRVKQQKKIWSEAGLLKFHDGKATGVGSISPNVPAVVRLWLWSSTVLGTVHAKKEKENMDIDFAFDGSSHKQKERELVVFHRIISSQRKPTGALKGRDRRRKSLPCAV